MKKCLLCDQAFIEITSLITLFSFRKKSSMPICQYCQKKFIKLGKNRCQICDKTLPAITICSDCRQWQQKYGNQGLLKNHAIFQYNDFFHDLMVAYKRYGDYILYQVLEQLCVEQLSKLKFDYYIPIPTSPEHQAKRKFDTVSAIYQNIVLLTPLLTKISGTTAQGEKNRQQRLLSKQSFIINESIHLNPSLEKPRVLLLDDIYTTGATLYHARDKIVEIMPNAKIESFVICH